MFDSQTVTKLHVFLGRALEFSCLLKALFAQLIELAQLLIVNSTHICRLLNSAIDCVDRCVGRQETTRGIPGNPVTVG